MRRSTDAFYQERLAKSKQKASTKIFLLQIEKFLLGLRDCLLVTLDVFDLTSSQPPKSATMSDSLKPNSNDRSLQRAFTNRIVDEYFDHTESWLRAILRMSVFSLTYMDGHSAMLIECPNQAVARRLSRKTTPLQQVVSYISSSYPYSHRVLICYQESNQSSWRCFDTDSNTWKSWESLQTPTATSDQ